MEKQSDLFASDNELDSPDPTTPERDTDEESRAAARETFHGRKFNHELEEMAALEASGRIEEVRAYLREIVESVELFTHSNRLMDARVATYIRCSFARQGETRYDRVAQDLLSFDIGGDSKPTPKKKFLLHAYEVSGKPTSLVDAITKGRPAGLALTEGIDGTRLHDCWNGVDPLDKRLLLPTSRSGSDYAVWLPKTPAFLMPAMRHAAQTVVLEHAAPALKALAASVPSKGQIPSTINIRLMGRLVERPRPYNFSFYLNQVDGTYPQPLFLPPAHRMTAARRLKGIVSAWQQNGRFPWPFVQRELAQALADSGFDAVMAHQKKRHQTTEAIDNVHTRDAYMSLGESLSMRFSELIGAIADMEAHDAAEDVIIEARGLMNSRVLPESWQQSLFNHALAHLIPVNAEGDHKPPHARKRSYARTESGKAHLMRGIANGWLERDSLNRPEEREARLSKPRPESKDKAERDAVQEGRYLNITLSASEVDLGSNGISIGVPAPTAIYGFVHNLVERQTGLPIRRFRIGIHRVELNDQVARGRTIGAFLTAKDQDRSGDDTKSRTGIISHVQNGTPLHAKDVVLRGGRSQAGTPSTTIPATNKAKAINAPWHTDLKGNVRLTVQVELREVLDAQECDEVISRLSRALSNARLGGGGVFQHQCRLLAADDDNMPPGLGGFGFARHPIEEGRNPLVAVYESVSFMNGRYLGDTPLGALSTGYEKLLDAGEMNVRGDAVPACHAETMYSIFRFCRASGPDNTWFVPRFKDDHFTLCDSLH